MGALEPCVGFHLAGLLLHLFGLGRDRHSGFDLSLARFLAPATEHEGMDVQGFSDILDLHTFQLAEPNGLQFEFSRVPLNLLWRRLRHKPSFSSVRPKCPLFRVNYPSPWSSLL